MERLTLEQEAEVNFLELYLADIAGPVDMFPDMFPPEDGVAVESMRTPPMLPPEEAWLGEMAMAG